MLLKRTIVAACSSLLLMTTLLFGGTGCASPSANALVFNEIGDGVAVVGREYRLVLLATDVDGDAIGYVAKSDSEGFEARASVSPRTDGSAVLSWVPDANDVGEVKVVVTARGGGHKVSQTVTVDVRTTDGTPPVIVEPRNSGTLVRKDDSGCFELEIVVDHNRDVEISRRIEPDNATLRSGRGLTSTWRWCPTRQQWAEGGKHKLVFTATDGVLESETKSYLIVLQGVSSDLSCSTNSPVVTHTSVPQLSTNDDIEARITDAQGVDTVFVCASTSQIDAKTSCLSTTPMTLVSGDNTDGVWRAKAPNPSDVGVGASTPLYYYVAATDNDVADPRCNHSHVSVAPSRNTAFYAWLDVEAPIPTPGDQCVNDRYESNDWFFDAAPIYGTVEATLCNDGDFAEDDFYEIDVQDPNQLVLTLSGGTEADLDVVLFDQFGSIVAEGASFISEETVAKCVQPGIYYAAVYSVSQLPNTGVAYSLNVEEIPCDCVEDAAEPDNDDYNSRLVTSLSSGYTERSQSICRNDQDWYYLGFMNVDESIFATLEFSQSEPSDDIDFQLWAYLENDDFELMYPCSSGATACSSDNGQSSTSNENFEWYVDEPGQYFLVVGGQRTTSNTYDLCITDDFSSCPPILSL